MSGDSTIGVDDAQRSGIYAKRRFVRNLRSDIQAVRNAVSEPWSNGQTKGQINQLKTLKRHVWSRKRRAAVSVYDTAVAFSEHEK
jgi:transposase